MRENIPGSFMNSAACCNQSAFAENNHTYSYSYAEEIIMDHRVGVDDIVRMLDWL